MIYSSNSSLFFCLNLTTLHTHIHTIILCIRYYRRNWSGTQSLIENKRQNNKIGYEETARVRIDKKA